MISELAVVGVAGNGRRPMCDMEVEQVVQVTHGRDWLPMEGEEEEADEADSNGQANAAVGDNDDKITATSTTATTTTPASPLMLGKLAHVASSLMRLAKVLFVSTISSSWLTIFDWLLSHKDIVTLDWPPFGSSKISGQVNMEAASVVCQRQQQQLAEDYFPKSGPQLPDNRHEQREEHELENGPEVRPIRERSSAATKEATAIEFEWQRNQQRQQQVSADYVHEREGAELCALPNWEAQSGQQSSNTMKSHRAEKEARQPLDDDATEWPQTDHLPVASDEEQQRQLTASVKQQKQAESPRPSRRAEASCRKSSSELEDQREEEEVGEEGVGEEENASFNGNLSSGEEEIRHAIESFARSSDYKFLNSSNDFSVSNSAMSRSASSSPSPPCSPSIQMLEESGKLKEVTEEKKEVLAANSDPISEEKGDVGRREEGEEGMVDESSIESTVERKREQQVSGGGNEQESGPEQANEDEPESVQVGQLNLQVVDDCEPDKRQPTEEPAEVGQGEHQSLEGSEQLSSLDHSFISSSPSSPSPTMDHLNNAPVSDGSLGSAPIVDGELLSSSACDMAGEDAALEDEHCGESASSSTLRQLKLSTFEDVLVCEQNRQSMDAARRLFGNLVRRQQKLALLEQQQQEQRNNGKLIRPKRSSNLPEQQTVGSANRRRLSAGSLGSVELGECPSSSGHEEEEEEAESGAETRLPLLNEPRTNVGGPRRESSARSEVYDIKLVRRSCSANSGPNSCFRQTLVCSMSPESQLNGSNSDISSELAHPIYPIDGDEILQCRAAFRANKRLIQEQQERASGASSSASSASGSGSGGSSCGATAGQVCSSLEQRCTQTGANSASSDSQWLKSNRNHLEQSQSWCSRCNQRVYPVDKLELDFTRTTLNIHRNCFKCQICSTLLRLETYAAMDAKLYCPAHIKCVTPAR